MAITDEVLNELLKDYQKPEDLLGQNGLLKQLQKRLLEKAMGAELTVHLGYGKHDPAGKNSGNSRNGTSPKTLKGEFGNLDLATPRDRNGSFEPQIVAKGQRRFEGFDQAIISLYSRGLTTREIEGHLLEIYGVEVSPGLVSQVTDAVCADAGSGSQMNWNDAMFDRRGRELRLAARPARFTRRRGEESHNNNITKKPLTQISLQNQKLIHCVAFPPLLWLSKLQKKSQRFGNRVGGVQTRIAQSIFNLPNIPLLKPGLLCEGLFAQFLCFPVSMQHQRKGIREFQSAANWSLICLTTHPCLK